MLTILVIAVLVLEAYKALFQEGLKQVTSYDVIKWFVLGSLGYYVFW